MNIFEALDTLIEVAEGELNDNGWVMTVAHKIKVRDSIKMVKKFKHFIAQVCK